MIYFLRIHICHIAFFVSIIIIVDLSYSNNPIEQVWENINSKISRLDSSIFMSRYIRVVSGNLWVTKRIN